MTILMYHGITSGETTFSIQREVGAELYDVGLDRFREQMALLKQLNIEVNLNPTNKADIIVTFDDGELNNFTEALPILKEMGFAAYFFIIAKRVGLEGYMGWEELRKLIQAGMVIGSHGYSHEILTNLLDTQIEEELIASKNYLERNLNFQVDSLSIPRGFCNDKIIQMAYDVGYKHIFISDKPSDVTLPCYERIPVMGNWSIKRFEQAITGYMPIQERMINVFKRKSKFIFKEKGYNFLRNLIIKILK